MVILPLFPEPLDASQLPEPKTWDCELCKEPMRVWDWGDPSIEPTARAIIPPPAICSACLVELADPVREERIHAAIWQDIHHQMWFRVGEPPGTLIAWPLKRLDQGGKPVAHNMCAYFVRVD